MEQANKGVYADWADHETHAIMAEHLGGVALAQFNAATAAVNIPLC